MYTKLITYIARMCSNSTLVTVAHIHFIDFSRWIHLYEYKSLVRYRIVYEILEKNSGLIKHFLAAFDP